MKPRIKLFHAFKLSFRVWHCIGCGMSACGKTPEIAYNNWKYLVWRPL